MQPCCQVFEAVCAMKGLWKLLVYGGLETGTMIVSEAFYTLSLGLRERDHGNSDQRPPYFTSGWREAVSCGIWCGVCCVPITQFDEESKYTQT